MKNENYIVVQGWMINELGLMGNKLMVYALIYGFSQDGNSEFKGSKNYIANSLQISERTVINVLMKLWENDMIFKVNNHPKENTYKCNLNHEKLTVLGSAKVAPLVVQKFPLSSAKSAQQVVQKFPLGSAKVAHNKEYYNNSNKNRERIEKSLAIDFLKQNSPGDFEVYLMQNKKLIKDFEKMQLDFNDTVEVEGLDFSVKILFARLRKYTRNWVQYQDKFNAPKEAVALVPVYRRKKAL